MSCPGFTPLEGEVFVQDSYDLVLKSPEFLEGFRNFRNTEKVTKIKDIQSWPMIDDWHFTHEDGEKLYVFEIGSLLGDLRNLYQGEEENKIDEILCETLVTVREECETVHIVPAGWIDLLLIKRFIHSSILST